MAAISPPQPFDDDLHITSNFDCGVRSVNHWLRNLAQFNELRGAARTYVVCVGNQVIGFYSLAASSVQRSRVSSRVGRSMPAEIPVVLLGQLGVDKRYQGKKLGSDLLTDAYKRVLQTSDLIGVRALMVQATDDQAKSFYERRGFSQFSDREPLMLIVRISQLKN